jgi:hypothetical protein
MAKSTAVSEAAARELKEKLERRGFTVTESKSNGYAKLTLNTNEASILIEQESAVSVDVFGNALDAYTPHKLSFASRNDAMSTLVVAQIYAELGKVGMKVIVKTHATVLATAEAATGDAIEFSDRWKTKGI